jgi:hypothetical protein
MEGGSTSNGGRLDMGGRGVGGLWQGESRHGDTTSDTTSDTTGDTSGDTSGDNISDATGCTAGLRDEGG